MRDFIPDATPPLSDPLSITLERLAVRFRSFSLEPLTMELPAGSRIALLGHNGAGKSTLMRALAGILPAYEGSLRVGGCEVRDLVPEYRRRVGLLPEKVTGTPEATVGERLQFLAALHPEWDEEYAAELMSRLSLSPGAHVGTLSKGMALKLSFVAAEAYRPPLLLLDEPTSGLDPVVRREFLTLLQEILDRDSAPTVVYSTHLLEDVEVFAHRVLVLRSGRLVRDELLSELRRRGGPGGLSTVLFQAVAPPHSD